MKVFRSADFNTSAAAIWENNVLKLGEGPIFTAKVVITGFGLKFNKIHLGPVIIRQYDEVKDAILGTWTGRKCVVELKFQEKFHSSNQETPLSMYVEPSWLLHSIFLAFQMYVDAWVGMLKIHYFNSDKKLVVTLEGKGYSVADTRSILKEPIIKRLNRKLFLKILNAQFTSLELAIDRYCIGCTEIVDESIIDFIIVLENLLGVSLGAEISHRISVRGALLLGTTKDEIKSYYTAIKYLYGLRSEMVHGSIDEIKDPNSDKKKLALQALGAEISGKWWRNRYEISDVARKIARKTLLYFIKNPEKWNVNFFEDLELHTI